MRMNIVDDLMRHPDDKPTIGLLPAKEKNKTMANYALAGYTKAKGQKKKRPFSGALAQRCYRRRAMFK